VLGAKMGRYVPQCPATSADGASLT
jgi:hypothetical protein